MIILPILVITLLAFVFSSSVVALSNNQFVANCPLPIFNGVATNLTIVGSTLDYDITYGSGNNASGTMFNCFIDNITNQKSASTIIKPYGATAFNTIAYGWFSWVGDTITAYVGKIIPNLTILYLLINAPASVSAMSWWGYVNLFFVFCIGLGGFMIIRGS